LAEQKRLGILGVEPVEAVAHSRRYGGSLPQGARVIDLGSGAGIPGLVLGWDRSDLTVTLVDVRQKRADQLERLVRRLGLRDRVRVVCGRVEAFAAAEAGRFDAVVARKFGPPESVLAVAAVLLDHDGVLVVSAAPDDRWDELPEGWRRDVAPDGVVVVRRERP
jgi:16S rRNA G527 N7-methylase RsmG